MRHVIKKDATEMKKTITDAPSSSNFDQDHYITAATKKIGIGLQILPLENTKLQINPTSVCNRFFKEIEKEVLAVVW